VRAKARFANGDSKLFPSQFVNLRLQVRTIKDAVVVPVTALRHGANGDFVYVLNAANKTASIRPVTRGQATVDTIEIKTGLTAGEQVITEGADRLKDGAKVTLPGDRPAGAGGGAGRRGGRGGAGRGGAADQASAGGQGAAAPASAPASVPGQGQVQSPAAGSGASAAGANAPGAAAPGERQHRRREAQAQ
jgi:multidrug efflux system membrane fusion protein